MGSTRKNAEPLECQQGRRHTCLHDSYYRRVFRGDEVVECAVLKNTKLTAQKWLSDRALDTKVNELKKPERSDTAELVRTNAELKEKLEAAEKRIARVCGEVRENGQGTKRRMAQVRNSNGGWRRPTPHGSPKMKSLTHRNGT